MTDNKGNGGDPIEGAMPEELAIVAQIMLQPKTGAIQIALSEAVSDRLGFCLAMVQSFAAQAAQLRVVEQQATKPSILVAPPGARVPRMDRKAISRAK